MLVIGDSVSDGYIPYVQKALNGTANAQHGPNNAGGGCADGAAYGAFCTKYFVRTPHFSLPPWDVITFNYGLHDGGDTNASYTANLESIADQVSIPWPPPEPGLRARMPVLAYVAVLLSLLV